MGVEESNLRAEDDVWILILKKSVLWEVEKIVFFWKGGVCGSPDLPIS